MPTRAFLLDVEGTTTPISFVHDVLFPYAREHFELFLKSNANVDEDLQKLRQEHAEDVLAGNDPASLIEPYVYWLMDRDRKSPALKSLQGRIWEAGYHDGSLMAAVFDDVPRAFQRWTAVGQSVNIFSSGSVLAQKLLFKHTEAGDLTKFVSQYFDTGVGKKNEKSSYEAIAHELGWSTSEVHFISDVVAELDAAADAGMMTSLCVRPGNQPIETATRHSRISNFDEVKSVI